MATTDPSGNRAVPALPRLLVLTDRSQLRLGRGLVRTITECVDAGLTHVVVREHDLAPEARSALVAALVAVPGLTVISSRILDPSAHGLHLPAAPPPTTASTTASTTTTTTGSNAGLWSRKYRFRPSSATITPRYTPQGEGEWGVVGRSCHSAEDVRRAAGAGADYVTLSPFAATRSKPGHGPALGSAAYPGHEVPVFALGGIGVDNAATARAVGAHGVAVMGEVMRSADPPGTVARLLETIR
ncbi:hypothetical protein ASG90_13770 [Nocardioides sp. Soil797]|nr:hypothetical protein ASG90_13770 [Nocardioides sp. Soil797]